MCQDWLREVTWLIQHWLEEEEGPRQFGSIDGIRERRFELINTFGMIRQQHVVVELAALTWRAETLQRKTQSPRA